MESQQNIIYPIFLTVKLPPDLCLDLDYDLLNDGDIQWISENCPHILEDSFKAPPPILKVSYKSTLDKYVKQPKRMKKVKTVLSDLH